MKNARRAAKALWKNVSFFVSRMRRGVKAPFSALCRTAETELLSDHGDTFCEALREALRAVASVHSLPSDEGGTPLVYAFAREYLQKEGGVTSQKSLCESLDALDRPLYDEELWCLPHCLALAAADYYLETGEEACLSFLIRPKAVDFEEVFFAYSAVERIFRTEAAGVFADSDRKTRLLYHDRLQKKARKKGRDAIALARETVANANKESTHIGAILPPKRGISGALYFYFLVTLTLSLAALYMSLVGGRAMLLAVFAILPIYTFAKELLPPFFAGAGERHLPSLERGEALARTKVLVCIMTLLFGKEKDGAIFDKLEDLYLTSGDENCTFAVFCDLPTAKRRKTDGDEALIAYAKGRIGALTKKYGDHFALFIRERRHSKSEDAYIGWERKRGGVLELCRFLRGKSTGISVAEGDQKGLSEVSYLITLDADTNLYIGAVRELTATMLHPENRPRIDRRRGIVTAGHGILQPRMTTALHSVKTPFATLTGGEGGIDIYAGCAADLYQQVFDEGSFCGKGILDVDAYLEVCDGFFPNERILSHDLAEGNLLRSALAADIVLTDSTPKTAVSYYTRAHRWLRGDLQMLPYLCKTVRDQGGKRRKNPMSHLGKYKILDNVLRGATPTAALAALIFSLAFGRRAVLWTAAFSLFYIVAPLLYALARTAFCMVLRRAARLCRPLLCALRTCFFRLSALAYEAYLFGDAAVRTLYRFLVSRKNFLNWTTASEGDGRAFGGLDGAFAHFWFSPTVGIVFFLLPLPLFRILGLFFLAFPFAMVALSKEGQGGATLDEGERASFLSYAHEAWLYFRDLVGEETNFLPPDNYQLSPVERVAMRTSPTNIGLYLLSVLAARDHGFITTAELHTYAEGTLRSLRRMQTWNGHFYNWYDLRTLEVIGGSFVSTVDSGNFVTALVPFCEGLREYAGECTALLDTLYGYERLLSGADLSALYNAKRHLFYIGYDAANARYSDSFYDTWMSEARTMSYFAVATRAVPREHYFALSRRAVTRGGGLGIASWSGTAFEYFMPSLFLPTPKNSLLDAALSYAFRLERRCAILPSHGRRPIFGVSESGYFAFDYEMNYQYRAFGLEGLALDPRGENGRVIAPYASFLMAEWSPRRVLANLSALSALSMRGKYGFFEAIDLDPARVGGGYAVIKSYMAHHLGMTVVAATNAVKDGIFRRRFMASPMMRASAELLSEKVPMTPSLLPYKRHIDREEPKKRPLPPPIEERPHFEYGLLTPEVALLSNNKSKIFASSSGHIVLEDGGDSLCLSDFDRFSLSGGLRLYAVIDGRAFPTVPLGFEPEGFEGEFAFSCRDGYTEYASRHRDGKREYGVTLRLSVYPDRELFELSLHVTGRFRHCFGFLYFEPILEKKRSFEAHRSFSNLFIESEYYPDEDVLMLLRRPRGDKQPKKQLAVGSTASIASFDTMRDRFLPLMPTEETFADLSRLGTLSGSTGAVIVPGVAIRSGEAMQGRLSFTLGYGHDGEELLYAMTSAKGEKRVDRERRMADIVRLQKEASGLYGEEAPLLERYILRSITFGGEGVKGERTVNRGCLFRHGISGEHPILLARLNDNEGQRRRLYTLISLFKYMCIRGVRFDFVVLYSEADGYRRPVRRALSAMVKRAGCENFLSFSGGIFLIAENDLDPAEREGLEVLSDVAFDLSLAPETAASANLYHVPLSKEAQALLLRGAKNKAEASLRSELTPIRAVLGGYFHGEGFVVEKPHGNIPWGHILCSERLGTVLTENSLGFTYLDNAGLQKLTPHRSDNMREDGGERLILRIYDRFSRLEYEDFDLAASASYVNFAFGLAEYFGQAEGIAYRLSVAVTAEPCSKRVEVFLEGGATEERTVGVAYTVVPCLGEREERPRLYRYRKEKNGVGITRLLSGEPTGLRLFSTAPSTVFLGETAFRSDGRVTDAKENMAAVYAETSLSGAWSCAFFLTPDTESGDFAGAEAYTLPRALFSTVAVKTADPLFDEVVNKWAPYQTLYSRILGRCGFYQVSGAYGFRDQLQDGLSLVTSLPEVAKALVLRAASRQYENGSVMHWWHEESQMGIMTRCSDDFLWLILAATTYAEMTGDEGIFDTEVAYLSSPPLAERETERYEPMRQKGEREPLLLHLCRAAEYGMRRGQNGLPLMGSGDWNDGMNLVGIGGQGESVWLAFFTATVLHRLIPVLRRRGYDTVACRYEREADSLLEAAERAYDGGWYRRGYYDDGSPLGSVRREECKLDLMPQAFAAMAAEELGRLTSRNREAMRAVDTLLFDRENRLLRLLYPPFSGDEQSPGYIKGYVPGIRENGGQYTHGAVFAALGFFAVGDNRTGAEVLLAIHPAVRYEHRETARRYKIEPYVLAGDVYANPAHMGRGGWSFYTGSAAWYRRAVIEVLCGFTERGNGFYLRPHLSDAFSRFELTVDKAETRYHIAVTLGEKESLTLDGRSVEGEAGERFFPYDGGTHEIRLTAK